MEDIENNQNESLPKEVIESITDEKEPTTLTNQQKSPKNNTNETSKTIEDNTKVPIAENDEIKNIEPTSPEEEETLDVKSFIWQSLKISFPGIFFTLYSLLIQTSNLIFIGQKYNEDKMIQGIGISGLYINCTLMAIYTGLISGLETLYPNAYAIKKYRLMGYYYQRARIIGYTCCIILSIIHFFTTRQVFGLFGFEEIVVDYAYEYVIASIIYCIFDVQAACAFRAINVLEKENVNLIIIFISLIFHPLWNFIFITILDMEIIGAGISMVISKFINFLLCTVYLWYWHPCPQSNFWIDRKCFDLRGLLNYLKFSIGICFLTCAEWWGYEVLAIIAMIFGDNDYTVYVLLSDINEVLYSLPNGFSLSITIQIGELIASAPIKTAKKACYCLVIFSMGCMAVVEGTFYIFSKPFLRLFTDEEHLLKLGNPLLKWVAIGGLLDVFTIDLISIMRGLGRQYTVMGFLFFHFYILMTGLAFIFGKWVVKGVGGMWIGVLIGDAIASVVYSLILIFLDFKKCKEDTLERIENDNQIVRKKSIGDNRLVDSDCDANPIIDDL